MKSQEPQEKKFRQLSDEELKQVTGGGNRPGDLTGTGGAGSGHNPIYASDDNLPIGDNGKVCVTSQRELCEMNGGTFTTDCHCIY